MLPCFFNDQNSLSKSGQETFVLARSGYLYLKSYNTFNEASTPTIPAVTTSSIPY